MIDIAGFTVNVAPLETTPFPTLAKISCTTVTVAVPADANRLDGTIATI
jgi:hypothetical protein